MLIKGDKIKLIKTIGNFDKVGDIFEIIGVSELGTVTIASSYGTGIMSYDEFEKYFEKVEKESLVWSEWKRHINDPNYDYKTFEYRTNGKDVEVVQFNKKIKSSCLPEDEFNLQKGIKLCLKKQEVLILENDIRRLEKKRRVAIKELNKINRELGKDKR